MKKRTGPKPIDLSGRTFGRLRVLNYHEKEKWVCECNCGQIKTIQGRYLRSGQTQSCGCLLREVLKSGDIRRVHGKSSLPEYFVWRGMIYRCTVPSASAFERYGGRGIRVCDRWMNFENFLEDMGRRPFNSAKIDRINNNGNYEPGNCRWATHKENSLNKSNCVLITANGQTKYISEWATELGVSTNCLRRRLKRGLTHEEIVNLPFKPGHNLLKRRA